MPSNDVNLENKEIETEIKIETDNSDLIDYFIKKEEQEQKSIDEQKILEEEENQEILKQQLIDQQDEETYQLELYEENKLFQKDLLDSFKIVIENQSIHTEQLIYIKNFNNWLIGINTLIFVTLFCTMISVFFSKISSK